jgi:hypothetical protein
VLDQEGPRHPDLGISAQIEPKLTGEMTVNCRTTSACKNDVLEPTSTTVPAATTDNKQHDDNDKKCCRVHAPSCESTSAKVGTQILLWSSFAPDPAIFDLVAVQIESVIYH